MLACILLLISGCWAQKEIITCANITQPVLVGKVKTIGGEPVESSKMLLEDKFSVSLKSYFLVWSTMYYGGWIIKADGSNKIDQQLIPLSDNINSESPSMLIANSIRFNVLGGYWIFAFYSSNTGWIEGAKYTNKTIELKN